MKKRTSSMSRRIVSLLMSMVLTLTLVTPAAFAEGMGVYANGEGTAVTTPADIATQEGEDTSVSVAQRTVTVKQYHANEAYEVKIVVGVEEGVEKLDTTYTIDADTKTVTLKLTTDGYDGEPVYIKTALDDVLVTEGKNQTPALTKDTPELEYALPEDGDVTLYYGTQEDFNAPATQRTVTVERYRTGAAYEVKIVVGVEEDGTTEKLDTTYTIGADTKTVTLKLTTADDAGEPVYIKTALDDVLVVTEDKNKTPALTKDTPTLEYTLPNEGDVTLYYGTQADFVSAWYGDGSATEYTIRTAEELAYLAQVVNGTLVDKNGSSIAPNTFSGKSIALARDIDLSAVCHPADEENGIDEASWTPIGDGSEIWDWSIYPPLITCSFEGEFDGQGHTVSKLHAVQGQTQYVGLFGYVVDGTIKNLVVSGAVSGDEDAFGGSIVGCADGGIIKGCVNKANVESGYAGGIVGKIGNAGTVVECQNIGEVKGNKAGGIAGAIESYIPEQVEITNCLNTGAAIASSMQSVNAEAYAGGIVGLVQQDDGDEQSTTLNSCRNEGEVTVTVPGTGSMLYAGGIAGYGISIKEGKNLSNTGNVTNESGTAAGLVAFINDKGSVTNSYNHGNVTGAEGKVFGLCEKNVTNSYYICKLNDADDVAMKYVLNNIEQPVTYEEATQSYKVGENTLVKTLNNNKADGLSWFVNIPKGITKPIFVKLWDGTDHPDYVLDGTEKEVYVTYDPNGGGGNGTSVSVAVTLNEDGTVKEPGTHTILDAEAAKIGEKDFCELKDWNVEANGEGTTYTIGQDVSVSEDLTLYAQWELLWKGSGTESDPYQIENEADWLKMQKYAEKYEYYHGAWFALMNDINLDSSYEPFFFRGNLKGNGNTITVNVSKVVETGKYNRGLFSSITGSDAGMRIENLTIVGSVTAYQYAGGLAGSASGNVTLENVTNTATVCAEGIGTSYVAGGLIGHLAGKALLTVKNCRNEGAVTGHTAGGLVGSYNGMTMMDFSGCTNSGTVRGEKAAAGLLGFNAGTNDPTSSFTNCSNTGEIIASGRAAGIAVLSTVGKVEGCTNSGAITGDIAAGILCSGVAKRSVNTGKITGKTCGAGIAANNNSGYTWYTMEFCANFGEVTAVASVNGLRAFGIARQGKISNCFTYNKTSHVPISGVASKQCTVSDSYYLANSDTEFPSTMGGEYATLDDFASGKVAWGVDGGTGAHASYWTQGANNYPVPIGEGTSTSYYRAKAECGTGGAVSIKSSRNFTGDADNAVYGPKGMSVTVTATPKDDTFGLKSLTLDLMGTGSTTALESGDRFTLGEANALVVAAFASTGSGGSGGGTGGNGGDGDGTGTDTGDGAGDENDEGLQDGLNMDVEYNIKGLVLAAYAEWGANGGGKTFVQWLKDSPSVLRAFITNSLDNMAAAAKTKDTDEAKGLAALLLASLNEHSGLSGKNGDIIGKALQRYMDTGSEATFSTWLTTGSGMASGTVEEILAQYTDSLLNLTERLYANWESSGTSLTFPQWLDAQQVTMESLSENAEEPEAEPDDTQTSEAPEDVPDGQDAEGGASGGGNSVWEVIGTVVRENPIIVWSIVAVIAALVIVGAVRRYHKVKRDERDDAASKK